MKAARWKKAQKSEQSFWEWLKLSYADSSFTNDIKEYFSDILDLTDIEFKESDRYLDIGSGPSTVFLALDKGKRTAIDPLMDYYQARFPYLAELQGVDWIAGKVEDWDTPLDFNAVFIFNCLNHCENLKLIVKKLESFVGPEGHLIITQHCHTQKYTKQFFARTGLDKCHPHHLEKQDVFHLLKGHFQLVQEVKIDELDVQRVKKTNKTLKKKSLLQKSASFFNQPDRFTRYIYRAVNYFYRKQLQGNPSQSNYLFVFKKK